MWVKIIHTSRIGDMMFQTDKQACAKSQGERVSISVEKADRSIEYVRRGGGGGGVKGVLIEMNK